MRGTPASPNDAPRSATYSGFTFLMASPAAAKLAGRIGLAGFFLVVGKFHQAVEAFSASANEGDRT